MPKSKRKKELIWEWMADFPCKEYFKSKFCLLHLFTEEEMMDIIDKKYKEEID